MVLLVSVMLTFFPGKHVHAEESGEPELNKNIIICMQQESFGFLETYLDEPSARWGPLVNTITTDFTIDVHFDWDGVLPSPGQISSSDTKEKGIDGDILVGHPSGNLYIDSKYFIFKRIIGR